MQNIINLIILKKNQKSYKLKNKGIDRDNNQSIN